MGRVYRALVKADRWDELEEPAGQRPIGSRALTEGNGRGELRTSPTFANEPGAFAEAALRGAAIETPGLDPVTYVGPSNLLDARLDGEQRFARATRRTIDIRDLRVDASLKALNGGQLAAERYKTLAMRVRGTAATRGLRTVVISSASAGEGKTTIAINLAWSLALNSGQSVLLIDANFGAPAVGARLGLESTLNWQQAPESITSLDETMVRVTPSGLSVVPAPETHRHEPVKLVEGRFEEWLSEAGQRFDLTIIDSPPLLGSVDAQWLALTADATVIVARAGRTQGSRLAAARKLVPKGKRLGVVLNDAPLNRGKRATREHR